MNQVIHIGILFFYLILLFIFGWMIIRKLFGVLPVLLTIVGAWFLGAMIGVPITYLFSCLFAQTGEPILWGTVAAIISVVVISYWLLVIGKNKEQRQRGQKLTFSDIALVIFSFAFSTWLMTKTFHGGAGGTLFVGSNNVFDFGHALGIVRSFSWGNNIPFMSPFRVGLPLFYHFFFYYFVAIWEYFGVPIVWAMNIPSILSFASLLVMVYFLPQILLKQKKFVGWIAVLLTITHSTLTFWYLIFQKGFNLTFFRTIWRLPTYPFAGPFDGSPISIFMTLNNYVNQRHLAFGIGLGLFLIMSFVKLLDNKRLTNFNSAVLGFLTGGMFLWNIPVSAVVGAIIVLFMLFKHRCRESVAFSVCALGMVGISVLPFVAVWKSVWSLALALQGPQAAGIAGQLPQWSMLKYWWENLALLPFVAGAGFFAIPKQRRAFITPFLVLFIALCIYAAYGKHGFDQKFLSVLIIGVNVCAASGIVWLFERKKAGFRLLALAIVFTLTVSGVVDLMAVKNEFAYPLVDKDTAPVISWIGKNTQRNAIFVSYSDIIDPVVLAGRKNYFGFFGNIGSMDRSPVVSQVYHGDIAIAKANHISYILVPKCQKNDFPYTVDVQHLRKSMQTVYEDDRNIVFTLK